MASPEIEIGTVAAIESLPMSVGLAIAIVLAIAGIVGTVWTIAAVRANDKEALQKEIKLGDDGSSNAINRLEKKTDANHDILHGRVNKLMEQDAEIQYKVGYMEGKQDTHEKFLLKLMDHVNQSTGKK